MAGLLLVAALLGMGRAQASPAAALQITLDQTRAAQGTLTPAGGTLTARAADGTTFTLTVPENAVLSPLKVTMTPVAQLTGLGRGGGYQAAVHLEPEGMEFLEPLTLKITAPQALDPKEVRGFNAHGLGTAPYAQGRSVSGHTATLQLMHFSTPGVATLPDLEIPMPDNFRDRLEHELALDLRDAAQVAGQYHGAVRAELEAARTNPDRLKRAIRDFLTWRKEVERLALGEGFKKQVFEGWTLVAEGIDSAVTRAHAECKVNHEFGQIRDILGWVTWVKRNPRLAPYFQGKLAAFEQKAVDCASFDLNFTLTLDVTTTERNGPELLAQGRSSREVSAQLPVQYDLESGMLQGRGPTRLTGFTASGFTSNTKDLCAVSPGRVIEGGVGVDFKVGSDGEARSTIPLVSLLVEPNGQIRETSTLTLVMLPGQLTELFRLACPGGVIEGSFSDFIGWWALFPVLHDLAPGAWWRVPLTFERGVALYTRQHRYAGPPLGVDDPSDDVTMELSGKTTLLVRHTPR